MNSLLDDKVVLITGASGGIGRATAEAFGQEGARLALHGNSQLDSLERWVAEQPWRDRAMTISADVSSASEVRTAFESVHQRWGRIDVTVANAGIWPPEHVPLHELPEERIRAVLEVNLLGAMWTAREFLRCLAAAGPRPDGHGACLLFIGSTAGKFGERGHCDYASSKAALHGLMLSLKNEIVALDPRGRVNLIEPGWTATEMAADELKKPGVPERAVRTMPLAQLGRACDVARTALFLASPHTARHLSGQTLTVAGGMEGRVLWEEEQIDRSALLAD